MQDNTNKQAGGIVQYTYESYEYPVEFKDFQSFKNVFVETGLLFNVFQKK